MRLEFSIKSSLIIYIIYKRDNIMDPAISVGDKTPLVGHGVQSKSARNEITNSSSSSSIPHEDDNILNVEDTDADTMTAQEEVSTLKHLPYIP